MRRNGARFCAVFLEDLIYNISLSLHYRKRIEGRTNILIIDFPGWEDKLYKPFRILTPLLK